MISSEKNSLFSVNIYQHQGKENRGYFVRALVKVPVRSESGGISYQEDRENFPSVTNQLELSCKNRCI